MIQMILGCDLRNVSYGGMLQMELPPDAYLIGYADDVTAVVLARDEADAQKGSTR